MIEAKIKCKLKFVSIESNYFFAKPYVNFF
ncbi:hypothetical protein NB725_003660 [Pantoea ananatis]|nr:hypothetical protein [Pantoea ananatis]MCW0340900.1 hypothetical protein [Pantoea ananatis]MCW0359269.1 hypothetical protein [Pantoea ananatis]MCW0364050.1 hypothetical protein [Pantoea ananatis]